MKPLILISALLLCISCAKIQAATPYDVVPMPQEITLTQEPAFILDNSVSIVYPQGDTLLKRNAEFLSEYIAQTTAYSLSISDQKSADPSIILSINPSITAEEAYILTITPQNITIEGSTAKGIFYGIQTLRKSLPAKAKRIELPTAIVKDEPRFAYRAMHLDVGRHFFGIDFVKRYIDLLALHNMNNFHWHLTEDQGWRIASDKYPKLTEIAAYRDRTVKGYIGSGEYDNTRYGGYYTKDELREVVEYARQRYINVIPEIDMPGHMQAALAAYPELGCTGGPYKVADDWGVFKDVLCIGNDATFEFLETIFEELIEIFPSKYIHIGGDECPRERWAHCPKCQARIKSEGLTAHKGFTAEDALQSYTTHRIEQFLNERGRTIIGWDEILRGDLAPNAVVMSWQGTQGGIQAAKMGHKVIMAPNNYCYFDYYQTPNNADEPLTIGGCITVEQVYNFEPTASLTAAQASFIMGVQANLWTEYIQTADHVEYMVLPRMGALAEVQWTQPARKNYRAFLPRLARLCSFYQRDGHRYAKHIFELTPHFSVDQQAKAVQVALESIDDCPIYYTLDGTQPSKRSQCYTAPLQISSSAQFRAVGIRPSGSTRAIEKDFYFNKASFAKVQFLTTQPYPNYSYSGASMLVDGISGNSNFACGEYLGFVGDDVQAVIDLGSAQTISTFSVEALTHLDAWIMAPTALRVFASADGKKYKELASAQYPYDNDPKKYERLWYTLDFTPTEARYVKMVLDSSKVLPQDHSGAGMNCFLFIDEIRID